MEFELNARRFRCEKLSALQQLHLSRKIAPLLPPLAPLLVQLWQRREDMLGEDLLRMAELMDPLAQALASMKDADAEAVVEMTLCSVKVETAPGTWVPLWLPGGKMAAVLELNDMGQLLPIVVKVVVFNLGSFTNGLLTSRGAPTQASPTSSGLGSPVARTGH